MICFTPLYAYPSNTYVSKCNCKIVERDTFLASYRHFNKRCGGHASFTNPLPLLLNWCGHASITNPLLLLLNWCGHEPFPILLNWCGHASVFHMWVKCPNIKILFSFHWYELYYKFQDIFLSFAFIFILDLMLTTQRVLLQSRTMDY